MRLASNNHRCTCSFGTWLIIPTYWSPNEEGAALDAVINKEKEKKDSDC
jgi:hypothetical protein